MLLKASRNKNIFVYLNKQGNRYIIMKEFFLVLIGGICSAIGGCVAVWYQTKKARQIRMEELRGEQQLEACKKALSLIEKIQLFLQAKTPQDVLNFLDDNVEWFSMNQIILPHTFVENWKSIMTNLVNLQVLNEEVKGLPNGEIRDKKIKEAGEARKFNRKLAEEARNIVRKEMKLPEIKIKTPNKEKG